MSSKYRRKQCQPRRVVRPNELDGISDSSVSCVSVDHDRGCVALHEEQDRAVGNLDKWEYDPEDARTDSASDTKDPAFSPSVYINQGTSSFRSLRHPISSGSSLTTCTSLASSLLSQRGIAGIDDLSRRADSFSSSPHAYFAASQELLQKSALASLTVQRNYHCFHCRQVFSQQKAWERHIQMCHKGTFSLDDNNVRTNEKQTQFDCVDCSQSFSNKWNLIQHMKKHLAQYKAFPCPFCDKVFSHDCNRKIHMRAHTGEKPFTCDVCGRRFSHKHNMRVHLRTHTREKPYICSDCNKAFSHVSALKIHSRVHTGEKPYKCDICGKPFSHSSTLNVHKRRHTGEKPFQCPTCYKTFARDCILKNHLKTHTEAGFEFA